MQGAPFAQTVADIENRFTAFINLLKRYRRANDIHAMRQQAGQPFGGKKDIAMWMLDTDYDGRSIFPTQVFFPMAGAKDGWNKLAKNLKAELDEDLLDKF